METPFIESAFSKPDEPFETPLRPQNFSEFIGQEDVKKRLSVMIDAAKSRKEALGHCLFSGPPGLGKTTLAHIIAKAMGTKLVLTSGPSIERPGDLAGLLTSLKEGDVLFIDEIHRLPIAHEEYLYSAMEDFSIDLMIDSGANARSVQVKLHPFTLVGATTRSGLLSSPLRSRFIISLRLNYYDALTLSEIVFSSSGKLSLSLDKEAAYEIAKRSRGTPRVANNLLRWIRDFSHAQKKKHVSLSTTKEALSMLAIDDLGLDEMDKKILTVIIDHHKGGPVGLSNIAAACGEEPHTIEEVHEPFLILQGFLKRGPRGRETTEKAYAHMKKHFPNQSESTL